MEITKNRLIKIAKAGFPDRITDSIKFKDATVSCISGVYRLHLKKRTGFIQRDALICIIFNSKKDVQFVVPENYAFNHYSAMQEMVKCGIVSNLDRSYYSHCITYFLIFCIGCAIGFII